MNSKGFTLIELVMVIVLLGIIAVFVAPRMLDVTGTKAEVFADKLLADIRTARNLAMSEGRRYRVYFNGMGSGAPANGYIVVNDADADGNWGEAGPGEIALDPAGGNLLVILNAGDYAGITVSTPPGPPAGIIEFDSLGRPTLGGGTNLTVSPGGGTVTVTPQTGAVN